ncbi:MAG: aldehyde dehydrogenase family protein, partial [Chitinophagaceae bacterium]
GHGADVISSIMENFRFDRVFYSGSTHVGTIIYEMAAKKLVPVTLEMGGKCPCIIEKDANLRIAARRIAVTKFSNAGQMCVAPDHVIVHQDVKEKFVHEIKKAIHDFYNSEEQKNYYGKIVNEKHFRRLLVYMKEGDVIYGGSYNGEHLFIEPTLIENVSPDFAMMKEEFFG